MGINLKKILSIGLAAALATTMSVGFADGDDDDDDEGSRNKHRVIKALEPSVDTKETIVISLATNPIDDPEPACVALQIGRNLLMNDLNGPIAEGGEVTPADSVTLFATLDGVELVYEKNNLAEFECLTPGGIIKSLDTVLDEFLGQGGTILICPLCWSEREYNGTEPLYDATVASPFDIHDRFLTADKVITF